MRGCYVRAVRIEVEVARPAHDPAPAGWDTFTRDAGLPAVWRYQLLHLASQESWSPAVVALTRAPGTPSVIRGILVAVYRTVHPGLRPLRGLPLLLDVRLPGMAHRESWHLSARVPGQARAGELRDLRRAAIRSLDPLVVGTVYRTVTSPALGDLPGTARLLRPTLPGSVLSVPGSVEDWLASLRRKRAGSLRRRGRVLAAELDVRIARARTDVDAEQLAALVRAQAARYASRLDPRPVPTAAYLRALVAQDDVLTLTYQGRDGRLLAAGIALDSPDQLVSATWAAIPPGEGGPKDVYFDQYVHYVRDAVRTGRPVLRAGRGHGALKADVGLAPEPLWFAAAPRLPGR